MLELVNLTNGMHLLVLSKSDCFDFCTEGEFTNALQLVVVPQHNFVIWPFRTFTSTHECKDIASVEHLYNANPTINVSHKLTTEGQRVEYPETCLRSYCETVLVLVEAYMANFVLAWGLGRCHVFL